MRVTPKGQVTIPRSIRDAAGLGPGTDVQFVLRDNGEIVLRRKSGADIDVNTVIDGLRGGWTSGLTSEDIMRLTRK